MATTASLDSKQTTIAQEPREEPTVDAQTKAKPGAGWKNSEAEIHVLPNNRIPIVFSGLMMCVFLAAVDQVCVSCVRM